jgi:hypothetical protein
MLPSPVRRATPLAPRFPDLKLAAMLIVPHA